MMCPTAQQVNGSQDTIRDENLKSNGQAEGAARSEDWLSWGARGRVMIRAEVGQPTGTEVRCRQGTSGQSRPGEAGVTRVIIWNRRGRAGRSPAG